MPCDCINIIYSADLCTTRKTENHYDTKFAVTGDTSGGHVASSDDKVGIMASLGSQCNAYIYAVGFVVLCFVTIIFSTLTTWWRHQMETVFSLLALCAGNSPVPGEFPAQRPVTRRFDIFFDLRLNKRLSKQSRGCWFETPSRPLWRHCNDTHHTVWYYYSDAIRVVTNLTLSTISLPYIIGYIGQWPTSVYHHILRQC